MATILSFADLAFLLHDKTEPCSVPTMNLVGMVGSYSRETPPNGRDDSLMFGISFRDSVGSPSLRMSHQNTCPSVLVEKHSAPVLKKGSRLEGTRSKRDKMEKLKERHFTEL